MKPTLLVLAALAVPGRAQEADFKPSLLARVDALGAAFHEYLTPDFEPAVARLKELQAGETFKTCAAAPPVTAKETVAAACAATARAFQAILEDAAKPFEPVRDEQDAFDELVRSASRPEEKALGLRVRAELIEALSEIDDKLVRQTVRLAQAVDKACIGRPGPQALGCSIDQTTRLLEGAAAQVTLARRAEAAEAFERARKRIEAAKP